MSITERKSERIILIAYILGFLCMAIILALFQPLGDTPPKLVNPPDEHARFLVPWYICQTGKIPSGFEEEVRISGYGFSYVIYNGFPYIVQGLVMRAAHLVTDSKLILLYVGRSLNIVNGVLMAYVVYKLSKRLFADRRFQWLFCFVIMYWPEVIFEHSYVNSNSMCLLSTAIIIYALVCGYQEGFRKRDNICLSIGIILCALSYYNAYGYILVSILLFAGYFCKVEERKIEWREMFQKGGVISVLVLLGIGWWFIRSAVLYDGDILGLKTVYNMKIQYAVSEVNPLTRVTYSSSGKTIWEMLWQDKFLVYVLNSYIAVYGSWSIWANLWMYRFVKMFLLVALFGCILQFVSPTGKRSLKIKSIWLRRIFHLGLNVCILIPWILVTLYSYYEDYQPQGRYVLIMIVPLSYYLICGLQRLADVKSVLLVGRNKELPVWIQNIGVISVIILVVGSSVHMVFFRALPLYLEVGKILV